MNRNVPGVSSDTNGNRLMPSEHTVRPRTAPPASEQTTPAADASSRHAHSSSSDMSASGGGATLSKYDMLENRPIKPMQSRLSTNYPPLSPKLSPKAGADAAAELIGRPKPSDLTPQAHQRKRSASPVTRAINFTEDSDSDVKSQTAADLKAIKQYLMLGNRKTPTKTKASRAVEGQHNVTSAAHRALPQQPPYVPDKYSTPTRKALQAQSTTAHAQSTAQSNDSYLREASSSSAKASSAPSSAGHSPANTGTILLPTHAHDGPRTAWARGKTGDVTDGHVTAAQRDPGMPVVVFLRHKDFLACDMAIANAYCGIYSQLFR